MDQETILRLNELRQKSIQGTITTDELREGIRILREDRLAVQSQPKPERAKKSLGISVSTEDLLD